MKTISSLIFLMLFLLSNKSIAQVTTVTSGVFLTAKDYQNNKLVQEADCQKEQEKFKTNPIFSKSTFDVIYKGKKVTYQKKDLYAYRDCGNKIWRFYDNKEYEILEAKGIYIYSINKVVYDEGIIEKEPRYYFSIDASGEIIELTVDNLKLAYPKNKIFHNMIDEKFKVDDAIHSYDFSHKMFTVNYLFSQSKK
ncbi:MAG: hypothetical protein ABI448_10815 [Bacteroidia bacterium]